MPRTPASLRATLRGESLEPRIVPAEIGIVAFTANRNEGDAGSTAFAFTLIRGGDLGAPSSVHYTVAGSGPSPASAADFGDSFPSGTVHFDSGQGRATLTIPISGDDADEANEQFTVNLTPGTNATLTTDSATGTIIDDDGPVRVVTSTGDSGPGSLRAVVAGAAPGSTVTFDLPANSVIALTSGQIDIPAGRDLIIDGSGVANLTISGSGQSRIFRLNSTHVQETTLTVRGLTLADCDAGTGKGGAIGTAGELHTLTVENVAFRDNRAGEGGAIHSVFRGTLTVTDCVFLRNEGIRTNSELGAGAIYFLGPNSLAVSGSTFEGNRGINGGAIKTIAGRVSIESSVFRNNDVLAARFDTGQPNDFLRGYGGAVSLDRVSPAGDPTGGTFRIRNSVFENNTGRAAGGALYLYTGGRDALEIESSSFIDNRTVGLINASGAPEGEAGNGGAIELQSDTVNRGLIVAGSSFAHNRAVDRGGAIRMRNFPGHFYNNTFHDNRTTLAPTENFSGGLGGAIEMGGGASVPVFVRNNTFAENYATWTGGAILAGVALRADNNVFDRNTTDTFANGKAILSHIDGRNLSGVNNIQSTSNRGQDGNQAIPGGTTTADPRLAALASNGGPTATQAPLSGSAVIDAGSNTSLPLDLLDADGDGKYSEPVPFDQRGSGFPRLLEGTVDVGAFETGTVPPTVPPTIPPTIPPTVPPTVPPGVPPTVPPTVPPAVPPTIPPTVPPGVPPAVPPTVPPAVPPAGTFTLARQFAAGAGAGSGQVNFYNADASLRFSASPFGDFTGGVRTAAADFNRDGVADLVVGTGPGRATRVVVLDGKSQAVLFSVDPFEASFTGGVYVSAGDLTGDGFADLVVTPDEGGGPRADVYNGNGFVKLVSFFGIDDPDFRGGARSAIGDLNGDGFGDLVVAAGFQGGPRVAAFSGQSLGSSPVKIFNDFFAFEQTLRNGVFIATGDLDGDGKAEIIAGGGPGGGPRVTAFSAADLIDSGGGTLTQLANFFGGDDSNRGGIRVAVKDLDGDATADLVVGAGTGAGSRVTGYLGKSIAAAGAPPAAFEFDAFDDTSSGVFVG